MELEDVEDLGPSSGERATGNQVLMATVGTDAEHLPQLRRTEQLSNFDGRLPYGIGIGTDPIERDGLRRCEQPHRIFSVHRCRARLQQSNGATELLDFLTGPVTHRTHVRTMDD
jgi:hypothetical protein